MTHGFVRRENVLGFPSRVDVALLHALDVTLKFGGELRAGRRDICHYQMFDGVGGSSVERATAMATLPPLYGI